MADNVGDVIEEVPVVEGEAESDMVSVCEFCSVPLQESTYDRRVVGELPTEKQWIAAQRRIFSLNDRLATSKSVVDSYRHEISQLSPPIRFSKYAVEMLAAATDSVSVTHRVTWTNSDGTKQDYDVIFMRAGSVRPNERIAQLEAENGKLEMKVESLQSLLKEALRDAGASSKTTPV